MTKKTTKTELPRQVKGDGVKCYFKQMQQEKADKLKKRHEEQLANLEKIKREHAASMQAGLDGGQPNMELRESVKDIAKFGLRLRLIGHS